MLISSFELLSGTGRPYGATILYVISGTELAYGAAREYCASGRREQVPKPISLPAPYTAKSKEKHAISVQLALSTLFFGL